MKMTESKCMICGKNLKKVYVWNGFDYCLTHYEERKENHEFIEERMLIQQMMRDDEL